MRIVVNNTTTLCENCSQTTVCVFSYAIIISMFSCAQKTKDVMSNATKIIYNIVLSK